MAEKILNTRIGLKVDTLESWGKSTLPLKKGEVAFATIAATAGTGLTEPVVMLKVGEDGVKTFSQLEWNFYAKASDVLAACKSNEALTAFVNSVLDAEGGVNDRLDILEGDENTAGSVAKAIKDAIDALDLTNTYVAQEEGKSLVADTEITKLAGVSEGANKVEASTNGKIKIDGVDTTVYAHPESHTVSEISDFAVEVAKVKVNNAGHADAAKKVENTLTVKVGGADVIFDGSEDKTADVDAAIEAAIDAIPAQTDYTVTIEEDTTDSSIQKRYIFKQLGSEIGRIDLAKELVVTSGSVKEVVEDGVPYTGAVIGDKYIELVIANQDTPIYVPAKDLVDIYTTAEGAEEVQLSISGENVISAELTQSVKYKLNKAHDHTNKDVLDGITSEKVSDWNDAVAKEHEHTNKELLDSYTQTEEDLADAVSKKHSHENKTVIDGITAESVSAWNSAEQNAKNYADGLAGNYATAEHTHKIDDVTGLQGALDKKTNDADLKAVAKSGLIDDLSIGEGTVLVFDCGNATV